MIFRLYKNKYGLHLKIKIFNINLDSRLYLEYKTTPTLGIRNNTMDGKRILFLDYDHTLYEHLIEEIKYLQEKHGLSEFYIFKSSNKMHGYHAICLDKLDYKQYKRIIEETSIDEYYKHMPVFNDYKTWVLRIIRKGDSPPPKHIETIKSSFKKRNKSQAHWLFLKNHYNVKGDRPVGLDRYKKVYTVTYGTLNYDKK